MSCVRKDFFFFFISALVDRQFEASRGLPICRVLHCAHARPLSRPRELSSACIRIYVQVWGENHQSTDGDSQHILSIPQSMVLATLAESMHMASFSYFATCNCWWPRVNYSRDQLTSSIIKA